MIDLQPKLYERHIALYRAMGAHEALHAVEHGADREALAGRYVQDYLQLRDSRLGRVGGLELEERKQHITGALDAVSGNLHSEIKRSGLRSAAFEPMIDNLSRPDAALQNIKKFYAEEDPNAKLDYLVARHGGSKWMWRLNSPQKAVSDRIALLYWATRELNEIARYGPTLDPRDLQTRAGILAICDQVTLDRRITHLNDQSEAVTQAKLLRALRKLPDGTAADIIANHPAFRKIYDDPGRFVAKLNGMTALFTG